MRNLFPVKHTIKEAAPKKLRCNRCVRDTSHRWKHDGLWSGHYVCRVCEFPYIQR
jgi:late competence protein required for DNA uptake (superfamily II DNA/RNA helicase)